MASPWLTSHISHSHDNDKNVYECPVHHLFAVHWFAVLSTLQHQGKFQGSSYNEAPLGTVKALQGEVKTPLVIDKNPQTGVSTLPAWATLTCMVKPRFLRTHSSM